MPGTCRIVLLPIFLPLALAGAQAQRDSTRADSIAQKLKAVTVTEARAAGVVGGAGAVLVKTGALRASPAPTLEQALRESPFVHVRQNSRGEMELSVRGSDSRQVAVLVDGVPITLGWDHRTDPSLIPLTGASNLVIVRGLGSILNGPNTLGGSVEVSRDGSFGQFGSGRVSGGFGVDENAAFVVSLSAGREVSDVLGGGLTVRGGMAHRQRDGFALPGGASDASTRNGLRTNSDLEQTDAFASMHWFGASGRAASLSVSAFDAERGVPPEEHLTVPRLWRYPDNRRLLAAGSVNSGTFSTPFGHGSINVGGGYNAGTLKIESYSSRAYQTVNGTELGDERTLTGRALLTHSLPRNATFKAAVTTADVRYEETLAPAEGVDYRQRLFSGGAEVDLPLASRTSLGGGVVFDRATTPETGGRTPSQEAFDNLGWRAGLTHELNGEVRLHASASQRSRFPALRELYSGALNRFRPNPELKPETLLGFEAGFTIDREWGPIPDGTIQVIGFRHRLDDAVVRITLANPTRFMRVNRDRIVSTGAEILAGFAFGEDRDRAVTITGDAMLQTITVLDVAAMGTPTRHSENNPEARGMLELGLPLPWQLRGFANARYTGTQYCLNADSGSEMSLGSQTEADLAVEKRFEVSRRGFFRSLRALVSLDNVADATVFDSCGLVQPGRTLRVMFSFR